ncbi:HAMP domain-containing protein [Paenibacillus sp. LMG 31460]|uniref:histidine kinase n=1 Tax=Paenibacillus germinis TaxID=2654979 RepID=A0ABX1Z5R7_9BACL|nr:sensor histidine kinase [Paenibacillus germinis]NOU88727.1 HAMP domain-containing protein [Paenibacillus germinis]
MRRFAFTRIQSSIAVAFSCLILLTIIIMSIISYNLSADAVKKKSQDYTSQIIDQVDRNIKSYITSMEYISLMTLNHADVRTFMQSTSNNKLKDDDATRLRIRDYFRSILNSRKDITSIMLAGDTGSYFVSDRSNASLKPNLNVSNQSWFDKAREAQGLVVISPPHIQNIFMNEYRWVISFSREIRSNNDKQSFGVFSIDLDFDVINNICSDISIGQRGYIFIVDEEGKVIYHPQQQIVYSNLKSEMIEQVLHSENGSFITNEGANSRMYTTKNSGYGWKIVGVAYLDELVSNKQTMKRSFLLWGALCIMIGLVCAVIISHRLSLPIKRLESYMREIEEGNFNIRSDLTSANEIGKLSKRFNIMIGKISELMKQIVVEQEFKRKSELKALQAQINPHFLYNTLGSIVWMAEGKKMEEVVTMTLALSNLLRASIGKGSELIPIQVEIEHITNYLTIQKMRYKSKLDFRIDIDKEIMRCKTLKLILQPLVENCIYHGIKYKSGTGIIQIIGEKSQDCILLKVLDNGVGIEPEKLKQILLNDHSFEDKGVGVTNVNERIRLYFGEPYGLSFKSQGEGTEVTICIPIIE